MAKRRLALGLDTGTQSMSAVVIDIDSREKVFEHQIDYVKDKRLDGLGIRKSDYIIPPRVGGETDQPPELFFTSLDALFSDIKESGLEVSNIAIINHSAQQHGHVYLNRNAQAIFTRLTKRDSKNSELVALLQGILAYGVVPIWMTSNTVKQADFVRDRVGGREMIIKLSGSDAPLRFTGAVVRRVAEQFPEAYEQTENIQLISSLIPAALTGNSKVPIDFGNGCGTSLMDYIEKQWSEVLIKAHSEGLPGGEIALRSKLPQIVAPYEIVGSIATYFVEKYGFAPDCKIVAGSGDNPQSKVAVTGDLLSLGTSFVNMVSTDGKTFDMQGFANAMYDGLGRPFIFGCRTNGAMVWDQLRAMYGLQKEEYGPAEDSLQKLPLAKYMVFWQPKNESLPSSRAFDLVRVSHRTSELGADYAGLIDATLAAVYEHSKGFTKITDEPLYVTGGATASSSIMRRVAAIWNRRVIALEKCGAALGAAIAGVYALSKSINEDIDVEEFSVKLLKRGKPVLPRRDDLLAYHGENGYLQKFVAAETKLLTI